MRSRTRYTSCASRSYRAIANIPFKAGNAVDAPFFIGSQNDLRITLGAERIPGKLFFQLLEIVDFLR